MIAWPSLATLLPSDTSRSFWTISFSLALAGTRGRRLRGYWGGSRDADHGPLLTRPVSLRGGGGVYHCLDRNETCLVMVLNRLKKSFDKEISSYLDLNIIFCDLAAIGCPGFVVEYNMYGIFMYLILIRIFW